MNRILAFSGVRVQFALLVVAPKNPGKAAVENAV